MKKTLSMLFMTALAVVLLDICVAAALTLADKQGRLGSVVRYFEYGRSVPGKLARWETNPNAADNLYDTAWRSETVAASAGAFAAETEATGPVIRSYGMSFVNNILEQAQSINPDLVLDQHSGPGAPPNYTYALYLDDAENRKEGDIAVLGILSSAVPALAALSNRTWVFEQPAPFTYPVFYPDDDGGLRRVDPLINSPAAQRALQSDLAAQQAWTQQLADEDQFYSPITFGMQWLDQAPFARLVRRSLAKGYIERQEDAIMNGPYPHADVLQRMIAAFAQTARADGQIPIVMLVQSRDTTDIDLLAVAKPTLDQANIPYLATAEHFDPQDVSGFLGDGHYKPNIDKRFGAAFNALVKSVSAQ